MPKRKNVIGVLCAVMAVIAVATASWFVGETDKDRGGDWEITTLSDKTSDKEIDDSPVALATSSKAAAAGGGGMIVNPIAPEPNPTMPEDKMVAGKRTLKNFLATILAPIGKVLWVTGGGWSLDDTGADEAARSIGLSQTWLDFFNSEDADYDCDETEPVGGQNVHHEKGLDADGYVGWALYNTLFSQSLVDDGFVYAPNELVESLNDYCDFENAQDLSVKTPAEIAASLVPGDFAILPGRHMYVVVGSCDDGSLVIAHAATGVSSTGAYGGSVQLSSVSDNANPGCEAHGLTEDYMAKYPEWDERYDVLDKDTSTYAKFYDYAVGLEANGVFHWKDGVLEDPDGYKDMSADEILADLYE